VSRGGREVGGGGGKCLRGKNWWFVSLLSLLPISLPKGSPLLLSRAGLSASLRLDGLLFGLLQENLELALPRADGHAAVVAVGAGAGTGGAVEVAVG
jgi:hypothetical protein